MDISERKNRNGFPKIIIIVLVILIIPVFLLIFTPLYNNAKLNSFAKQLTNAELPKGSILLESHQACGNLNGNGDSMDFIAAILIKSGESMTAIREHYESYSFHEVKGKPNSNDYPIVEVLDLANNSLENSLYAQRAEITFGSLNDVESYNEYFIIILYDGYSPGWDYRGYY